MNASTLSRWRSETSGPTMVSRSVASPTLSIPATDSRVDTSWS